MNIERCKRTEQKRIDRCAGAGGKIYGCIRLDKPANPETVNVTLLGKPIIPESFNLLGYPIFTKEQTDLLMFKEEELKRQNGGKYIPLEATVTYEERDFDVPRSTFDTVKGIDRSLANLATLNEMLLNRVLFLETHEGERLDEFMIFGCIMLDQFGQVWTAEETEKRKPERHHDVERLETFCKHHPSVKSMGHGSCIPKDNSVCPCCGKKFTMDDVKKNLCTLIDGKFYHRSCWRNYRRLTEVDKLTRQLMSIVYKDTDYTFDLIPNGYCSRECCSHIPWFLFHTIDGDIIMGWRKRVISIEWQKNYKPFDMEELFGTEDVTKWEEDGKRGIHAWGKDKAYEYLKKVLATVNPGYSVF